jgi:hypothetical protein
MHALDHVSVSFRLCGAFDPGVASAQRPEIRQATKARRAGVGGLHPTSEDFTWAILISFASGFSNVTVLFLSVFDTARPESPARTPAGKGWQR